jgi:hypothetical protein
MGATRTDPAEFTFTATVWLWKGDSAWHFISLPEQIADDIEALSQGLARGFGSVPVEVRSGSTVWRTSLFPDKKAGTYILPLKKQVRQELDCAEGSRITVSLGLIA